MELLASRSDIKRKDVKAESIARKYSEKALAASALLGAGFHTKSQKEFKPLNLEHNYRNYSVSIQPQSSKNH
jgi:hypothetical protein